MTCSTSKEQGFYVEFFHLHSYRKQRRFCSSIYINGKQETKLFYFISLHFWLMQINSFPDIHFGNLGLNLCPLRVNQEVNTKKVLQIRTCHFENNNNISDSTFQDLLTAWTTFTKKRDIMLKVDYAAKYLIQRC